MKQSLVHSMAETWSQVIISINSSSILEFVPSSTPYIPLFDMLFNILIHLDLLLFDVADDWS